jgi:hypothetical protein|tara:strand:- start:132 stop:428 length:297 start_codon:yes stop_codon:yes gene_type:complete
MEYLKTEIESILKILDESANLQTKAWLKLEELRRSIGGIPVPIPIIEEDLPMMSEEEILATEMLEAKKSEHGIDHAAFDADDLLDEELHTIVMDYEDM